MIVPEMLVYSSFLISVCMFIVSKAFLISSAKVIVRAGGSIWFNPFATVLFSVCSAAIVVLCFVPVLRGCLLLCKEEGSSPVSLQLRRGGIWSCMRCLSVSWEGDYVTMLANFHMCGIKSSFQHARAECESGRACVF